MIEWVINPARGMAHARYPNVLAMTVCGWQRKDWIMAPARVRSCKNCVRILTVSEEDTVRWKE